jgi:hypothetical protein
MRHMEHMGIREMRKEFWWGNLEGKNHLEDLVVNGSIILKCIYRNIMGSFDRIRLAQDKDVFRASVTLITNLWGCLKQRNFLTS